MGFYVRDLYLDASRFSQVAVAHRIHDPLTDAPTIPETTPLVAVAQPGPHLAQVTEEVRDELIFVLEALGRKA